MFTPPPLSCTLAPELGGRAADIHSIPNEFQMFAPLSHNPNLVISLFVGPIDQLYNQGRLYTTAIKFWKLLNPGLEYSGRQ